MQRNFSGSWSGAWSFTAESGWVAHSSRPARVASSIAARASCAAAPAWRKPRGQGRGAHPAGRGDAARGGVAVVGPAEAAAPVLDQVAEPRAPAVDGVADELHARLLGWGFPSSRR